MSADSLELLLRETVALGRVLVERQETVTYSYKADGSVLSELDHEVQRRLYETIRTLPDPQWRDAVFVGEEEDSSIETSHSLVPGRWNWVVDAIDGTAAYTRGFNSYAISIALVDEDFRPVIGLIHLPGMPGRDRIAVAEQGRLERYRLKTSLGGPQLEEIRNGVCLPPSWLNGNGGGNGGGPLRHGYIYANSDIHRLGLEHFPGKVRNLGGTAAHLALLTDCGEDPIAVILTRCKSWDVAAGLALTEAAGLDTRRLSDWSKVLYQDVFRPANGMNPPLPLIVGHEKVLHAMRRELT